MCMMSLPRLRAWSGACLAFKLHACEAAEQPYNVSAVAFCSAHPSATCHCSDSVYARLANPELALHQAGSSTSFWVLKYVLLIHDMPCRSRSKLFAAVVSMALMMPAQAKVLLPMHCWTRYSQYLPFLQAHRMQAGSLCALPP